MNKFVISCLLLPSVVHAAEGNPLPQLAPPYGEIPPTFWQQHHTAVIVAGVVFLALAMLILKWILRPAKPVIIPPDVAARQALARLQNQPEDGVLLSAVSQILRRYTAAAFDLPDGELTTTEFCAVVGAKPQLGTDLSGAIVSFLRECDVRKFSPAHAAPPLNATERALRLVELAEAHHVSLKQQTSPNQATHK